MKNKLLLLSILAFGLLTVGAGCISFSTGTNTSGPVGMFLSTDRGENWQPIVSWPTVEGVKSIATAEVYRMVEDPNDSKAMYLATRNVGLFYTYNDGKSWQRSEGPFSTGYVYSVAVHPLDKCIIYATNGNKVYRTDDCSRSWQEVYRESRSDTMIVSLAFSYSSSHHIFMGESNGDLLQSYDSGISWSVANRFGDRLTQIITHPADSNLVYIIFQTKGLMRSLDGGYTWEDLSSKMKAYSGGLDYRRFVIDKKDSNKFYWVSAYGVLVSNDKGNTWQALELLTPPGSAKIYGFAVNPQNDKEIYYTATIDNRSTFYKSMDGGKNWITKKLPSAQIPVLLRVHPDNPSWIYLGFAMPPKQ